MWQDPPIIMRTYSLLTLSLLLVSCNSGGNTTATFTPPALATADLAITADNAIDVAQAGVRGSLDLVRLSYIGAQFLQTTFPEPPGEPIAPVALGTVTLGTVTLGTVLSTEVFGPENGVATFTWDDVDEDETYSSGDVFTMNFDDYGDQGMTLNGTMTIDNIALQGLLPGDGTYIVDANLNLLGLTINIGTLEQTFDTTLPFHMENRIIVELFDLTLLEPQVLGQFEVREGTRLSRMTTDETLRYVLDGAVHSVALEGLVRFSTPLGLSGSPFLNDPIEGYLLIRGAAGSSLELEPFCAFPGVCVSLDVRVDEDGDAEYENTQSTSWQALLPQ